jgi:hypothetical protein
MAQALVPEVEIVVDRKTEILQTKDVNDAKKTGCRMIPYEAHYSRI